MLTTGPSAGRDIDPGAIFDRAEAALVDVSQRACRFDLLSARKWTANCFQIADDWKRLQDLAPDLVAVGELFDEIGAIDEEGRRMRRFFEKVDRITKDGDEVRALGDIIIREQARR